MTNAGPYPAPKMKRLQRAAIWLFCFSMVGASIGRDWLGFWPSLVIFGLVMVAVLTPLAVAARRERDELEKNSVPDNPDTNA